MKTKIEIKHNTIDLDTTIDMKDKPFFGWLKEQTAPPAVFTDALASYFRLELSELAGQFKGGEDDEVTVLDCYRYTFQHFWWRRLNGKKQKEVSHA